MRIKVETVKGNFSGKFQSVYDWLVENQPSFATITVPSREGEFILSMKPELSIEDGWCDVWSDMIETVLEEKDFIEDHEMVMSSSKIFQQIIPTLTESSISPENVEELIRWAGHDVFQKEFNS